MYRHSEETEMIQLALYHTPYLTEKQLVKVTGLPLETVREKLRYLIKCRFSETKEFEKRNYMNRLTKKGMMYLIKNELINEIYSDRVKCKQAQDIDERYIGNQYILNNVYSNIKNEIPSTEGKTYHLLKDCNKAVHKANIIIQLKAIDYYIDIDTFTNGLKTITDRLYGYEEEARNTGRKMRICILAKDKERMIKLIKEHDVNKLDNIKFAVFSDLDELNSTIIKNIKLNGGL